MCTLHPFPLKSFVSISFHNWRVWTVTLKTRKKKMTQSLKFLHLVGPTMASEAEVCPQARPDQNPELPGEETCLLSEEHESRNRMKLHPPQPTIQLLIDLLFTQISVTFPRLTCRVLFIKQQIPFL